MLDGVDLTQLGMLTRGLTVVFALGVFVISYMAWKTRKKQVLLYVSLAFLTYATRSAIRFAEVASPLSVSAMLVNASDVLDLFTLLLIFFAVTKK